MRPWCSFAAALALVACAARPPEPPRAADREAAPAEAPSAEANASPSAPEASPSAAVSADEERPAGELVCRTVSDVGGATELFLDWKGSEADGTLREVAPSGMVHEKKVHAERHEGLVVADDIYEKDLVAHAAIVAERSGKKVMKLDSGWVRCQ